MSVSENESNKEVVQEEDEDEEIDPEDAQRILTLKNNLKNGVHSHILTEPLGVLLNKSASGHTWEKRNVVCIMSTCLKKLKTALPWLTFDENIDVVIGGEEGQAGE